MPKHFTAEAWAAMNQAAQKEILSHYRLAYLATKHVNWCPALGTVLANDEVKGGLSERGGHPVERRKLSQWSLRIQPYAERLLKGLETIDWPTSIKEIQRNWIGKSEGAEVSFATSVDAFGPIDIYTTRLDTIYGVTFIALAPEHPMLAKMIDRQIRDIEKNKNPFDISPETDLILGMETANHVPDGPKKLRVKQLKAYIENAKNLSARARQQEQSVSGVFTGYYAIHPITGKKIPIFAADYVLMHYGLGAIMGVPAHDQRDYLFAKHFNLPILQVINHNKGNEQAYEGKVGKLINSGDLTGLSIADAQQEILHLLAAKKQAIGTTKYRIQDPVFARQRYWGEPVPIYFNNKIPEPLPEKKLPLRLPNIDSYKPTNTGQPPLARANNWRFEGHPLETSTMPAWAGSSWYFLRYLDPNNTKECAGKEALNYWENVDLYIGGKEHATGHLIYARFFTKFLYDVGHVPFQEPFEKLFNQGMVQSFSKLVYRIQGTNQFVSHGLRKNYKTTPLRVNIDFVNKHVLDIAAFKAWRPDLADATFILENGKYICGELLEKMSKSKHNSISPETDYT